MFLCSSYKRSDQFSKINIELSPLSCLFIACPKYYRALPDIHELKQLWTYTLTYCGVTTYQLLKVLSSQQSRKRRTNAREPRDNKRFPTCTHTCTDFWKYLLFLVFCWQYGSQREMYLAQLKTLKNRLSDIKKAPLSAVDNRVKSMGDTGLEPVTSCV